MSILLLVNIIFVSYMIGSRRQAKATLGDSNEPSLVSEKGLDVDLLANDVRSSYVLFSEGDTFLYAFQKRPTVDASRERVGHTLVDRKNESTTKVLYDFSVAKGWGISRWLDSVEECETIILSGDTVNSTHVEIAGKIKGLKYLVLDSCPEVLRQSHAENTKFEIIFSEKTLIRKLLNSKKVPGVVILKNTKKGFPNYLGREHLQQVVELGRNRFQYPLYGNEVPASLQALLARFPSLQVLDLGSTKINDDLFNDLGKLSDLESLSLDCTGFNFEELSKLNLNSLRYLNLSQSLIKGPFGDMPNLEVLIIDNTLIEDSFFEQSFPKLKKLIVHNTRRLGEKGIRSIGQLPSLKSLTIDYRWEGEPCVASLANRDIDVRFFSQDWGKEKLEFTSGGIEVVVPIPEEHKWDEKTKRFEPKQLPAVTQAQVSRRKTKKGSATVLNIVNDKTKYFVSPP